MPIGDELGEGKVEWLKLPQDLQGRFFELAEEESRKIAESVRELADELRRASELLRFEPLPEGEEGFTVAAVDGSRSPRLSERLGVRYGVFSAGVVYLGKGGRREEFRAGTFKRRQVFSADRSKHFFDLLTVSVERDLALRALKEADLVLVDGSFYGFMYSALKAKEEGSLGEEEARLVREIADATSELVRSGRAVGIVKRSHTRVIGGYVALRDPGTRLKSVLDKMILSYSMPPRTYVDYRALIGDEHPQVYTNVARLIMWGKGGSDVMDVARRNAFRAFRELGIDSSHFSRLRRMQVRAHPGAPVCEVEFPADADLGRILGIMG
ncbi:MAG: DNA double-strand break repair nuclease NurA, partial [Conexivisphaera sp.]